MDVNGKIRDMPRTDVFQPILEETSEELDIWKVLDEGTEEDFKEYLDSHMEELEGKIFNKTLDSGIMDEEEEDYHKFFQDKNITIMDIDTSEEED